MPFLELFFAGEGGVAVGMGFVVDEVLDVVLFREAADSFDFMGVNACGEVGEKVLFLPLARI